MNKEKEAYWFSHDSNARHDQKIIALRMQLGWEGYGLYWAIVEKLREASDYTLSCDYKVVSFDLGVKPEIVKMIVEDFELFVLSKDGKTFHAERMIRNMKKKNEKSEKARESARKRWEKPQQKNNCSANVMRTHSDSNAIKEKESKGKNNKEIDKEKVLSKIQSEFYDSLKPFVSDYSPQMLREFFNYWSEPNKSRTKIKWQMEKTWDVKRRLQRWANNNFNSNAKSEPIQEKVLDKPDKW